MQLKIIGFTNPLESTAAPIITIGKSKHGKIFAVFPDCSVKELDVKDENKIAKLDTFIKPDGCKYIKSMQYSYLSYSNNVVTGDCKLIAKTIKNDLPIIKKIDLEHFDLLKKIYIEETKLKNPTGNVILFTTTRVKKNKEFAKRLFVQHENRGRYKTFYKKNLYTNELLIDQDSRRFIKHLNNVLTLFAEKYQNSSIKDLYKNNRDLTSETRGV